MKTSPVSARDRMRAYRIRCPESTRKTYRRAILKDPQHLRRRHLWTHYKLTLDAFDTMLAHQGFRCAICPEMYAGGKTGAWHIDHDHSTGVVRGLLCHHCNVGLGHFKESPELMTTAIAYLNRHVGN